MIMSSQARRPALLGVEARDALRDRALVERVAVGVVEHDHRILATELEDDSLEATTGFSQNVLAGFTATGEDHQIDGSLDQRLAEDSPSDASTQEAATPPAPEEPPKADDSTDEWGTGNTAVLEPPPDLPDVSHALLSPRSFSVG